MQKYTSQQYEDIFWKLPQEIRDAISSYSTTEHINIIGKKHDLQIDQIGDLVDLTLDVMMGIVSTKDFVKEIESELKISTLESSTVARNIDENVLKPIKEIMVHLYAGRAPYKPSSSLVQYYDEDEEHPGLKKDVLLKEIEEPSEAIVKKETTTTTESLGSRKLDSLGGNKMTVKTEVKKPTTVIEEYHEEIQNNTSLEGKKLSSLGVLDDTTKQNQIPRNGILNDPTKLLSSSASKLQSSDLLNKIAEIKLNKTFVMPRGEGEEKLSSLGLRSLEGNKSAETTSENGNPKSITNNISTTNPNAVKPEANAKTETPKSTPPTIDPYREKI